MISTDPCRFARGKGPAMPNYLLTRTFSRDGEGIGTRVPPADAEFPPEEVPTRQIRYWGLRARRTDGAGFQYVDARSRYMADEQKAKRFLTRDEAEEAAFPGEEAFQIGGES